LILVAILPAKHKINAVIRRRQSKFASLKVFFIFMIVKRLQDILREHRWHQKKIIVAVSGGADSMVLAAMLQQLDATIIIAHCNFGLRGKESDEDEAMVVAWAAAQGIPCRVQHFDTRAQLESKGGNLQETARELRYRWFEDLRQETGFDLIATAHHSQDSVETMLINFFKGTGIAGMHGILPQQQKIIRPLLTFTKEELQQYALEQGVPWREDSSNLKEDYTRNAVRHQLLPVIGKIFPGAPGNLLGNTIRFAETEQLYSQAIEGYRKKLLLQRNKDWYIPVLRLRHVVPLYTVLWELVRPFGFSPAQAREVQHLLEAETGRYVAARDFRIIRNRNFLIITPNQPQESTHILIEAGEGATNYHGHSLYIKSAMLDTAARERLKTLGRHEICVDAALLRFPLVLRPWKMGDYFYPFGMNRKKKKVSRFLIEQKVPLHEKEKVWVLESDKKIVWVVGMRADERFRVREATLGACYFSVKTR
jgi:tRNA(Ile)-lysidine synthase